MKCVNCGQNEGDFGPEARRCDFCGAGRKAQAELIALIDEACRFAAHMDVATSNAMRAKWRDAFAACTSGELVRVSDELEAHLVLVESQHARSR